MLPYDRDDRGAPLTREELTKRAHKTIRGILLAGVLLLSLDLAASLLLGSPHIETDQGNLYLIRPGSSESPEHISLDASVDTESGALRHRFDLRLDPLGTPQEADTAHSQGAASAAGSSHRDLLSSQLRSLLTGINENTAQRRILLPATLEDGTPVTWRTVHRSHTLLLSLLIALLIVFVYRNRLRPLTKREAENRRSILTGLPALLSELSLLMNAGLVLSRAFEKVITESGAFAEDRSDYFTQRLAQIYQSVAETHASLPAEFRAFAKGSGVSDLVRVSNIISDNLTKGSDLTSRLEEEAQQLWISRKLRAQEQGSLAETKMTIPLSLFLCVLIIITVAPAMLQL